MENATERAIKACLRARIPVIVTGPPGTGKTGFALTLQEQGCGCNQPHRVLQVIGSVREPTDIAGWPVRSEDGVRLEPPAWAVEATRLTESGVHTIILWDEMRTLTAPQQAALLKVIHEGLVGDKQLPPGVSHLACANSVEDSAGGVPLEPPMANRHVHLEWPLDAMRWVSELHTYAPQAKAMDAEALKRLPQERALIASFIRRRPELLFSMPKEEDKRDGPWPSPRTWDYAAHLWASTGTTDWEFREMLLAGCVGVHAAAEFVTWRTEANLPDPEDIISGKFPMKDIIVEDRPDRTYAILSSLVVAVEGDWTPERYVKVWEVAAYCAKQGAGDIAAAVVPRLMATQSGKPQVPAIAKYAMAFKSLLDRADGGR